MSFNWNPQGDLQACTGIGSDTRRRNFPAVNLRKMEIWGEPRDVAIRLVDASEKIQAARDLINDRYAWRGYGADHQITADAHHMTFTAEVSGEVVGTITLAADSAKGLAVDRTFKAEIDGFRARPDTKVCELTKFAFSPNIQSKELMAALFHIVFVYGHRTYGGTDLFIEVNPRHVRFYEAMLGFERVGALKENDSVAAPAQLMWLKVAAIRDYINRFAGGDCANTRSLYPFFFSPQEESGIYRRLMRPEKEAPSLACEIEIDLAADAAALLDSLHLGSRSASAMQPVQPDRQWANP